MARRKVGAKRKTAPKRKTTTRRRRRISGIGSVNIQNIAMKAAGLGVGAIAARELNTVAVKAGVNLSPTMSGLAQAAVGFVLPMVVKNNKFVADMGDGMIANGLMVVAVSTGVISGMSNPGSTMTYRINGTSKLNTIAGRTRRMLSGTSNLNTIAGTASLQTIAGRKIARGGKGGIGCY